MATVDRSSVQTPRREFADARRDLISKQRVYEDAIAALADAKRKYKDSELVPFQNDFDDAGSNFLEARATESVKYSALQDALGGWLAEMSVAGDFRRLLPTNPIVLFPVRLEARFEGSKLHVRMFPDEIFLNTHETALTQEEYDRAKAYYVTLNETGNEAPLWRDLVARYGAPRAAYLLRQMLPIFGEAASSSSWSSSSSTCGGTVTGGHFEKLTFPDDIDKNAIQFRAASWTRPGEAVLPDRWVVGVYSNGVGRYQYGNPIPEPLAMTPDPRTLDTDAVEIPGTGIKIDPRILWTVDYQTALDVGMAVDIDLQGNESTQGVERIVVFGVKTSMDELETSRYLEKLLDAHHYTRGMAIVRQGSPTNNMEGRPSPYPVRDNAGEASFVIERQPAPLDREYAHHCLPSDTDGYALAMMLGVPSGVMANVDRARRYEILRAKQMNTVLWSATAGYFLHNLMSPVFSPTTVNNARYYFENYVIGRGPAPAFRIGATPYGVLPISSLADWKAHTFGVEEPTDTTMQSLELGLLSPLQKLLGIWETGVTKIPTIRPDQTNPDIDIATVLSTAPSSRQFRMRIGIGLTTYWLYYYLRGWDIQWLRDQLNGKAQNLFSRIGFHDWKPRIGRIQFKQNAWTYTGDIVAAAVSETDGLERNFLSKLSYASPGQINDNNDPSVTGKPDKANLFYDVVRHSLLLEYLYGYSREAVKEWIDYEIFHINSLAPVTLLFPEMLQNVLAASSRYAGQTLAALQGLSGESTAELERLFTETLDLTSHRLDAWITAYAYRRVSLMRKRQVAEELLPKGDYLGGYGWLEGVKPRNIQTTDVGGGVMAEQRVTNGGFIHTPSLTHAAAAAVLRNAHMSFKVDDPAIYAIDLSSARVRSARELFEGVRNGQPLGALLGYQFERGLHEGYPGVSGLDLLRFKLRNRFPLVANQSGNDDPSVPADSIAARNVIDGCSLLTAYQSPNFDTAHYPELPNPNSTDPNVVAQYNAVIAELKKLAALYDATADLLMAESAFQMVSGNIDGAVPAISNIVAGQQPPASIFTRSARGGIAISHRVALVFPSDSPPSMATGWPAQTPRAKAEPILDAWLSQLIGPPDQVTCSLQYLDADGNLIPNKKGADNTVVALSELGLHPMDVMALAEATLQQNQASMLDRRIIANAFGDTDKQPTSTPDKFTITYSVASGRSFPEIFEVLGTAAAVIRASRPLALADLLPPAEIDTGLAEAASEPKLGTNAVSFYQRGQAAVTDFNTALSQLSDAVSTKDGYRAALIAAALYLPGSAFPDALVAESALKESAEAALNELNRRASSLPAPLDITDEDLLSAALIAHGTQTLQGIFGTGFLAMPDVDPPRMAEIRNSLQARSTLLGTGNDDAPDKYVQQIARARERVGRWRKLNIYARTCGLPRPRVDVVQLPYVPDEAWLGRKFTSSDPPTEGRAALLLLNYADSLDATVAWNGLVIDDWSEIIPNQEEQTGIAFHYETPQAQAPQAILVAAPSGSNTTDWISDELVHSLEQTMRMMKTRAVSQEYLDLSPVLPMPILTANSYHLNTVSSPFMSALRRGFRSLGLSDD